MPQVTRCLTEKVMTYALGRGLQPYDNRTITEISKAVAADGLQFPKIDLRSCA